MSNRLKGTLYVQGVSTRKVEAVTEVLCGHSFSASSISAINNSLDESLKGIGRAAALDAPPSSSNPSPKRSQCPDEPVGVGPPNTPS
jgi:hypothetical protein